MYVPLAAVLFWVRDCLRFCWAIAEELALLTWNPAFLRLCPALNSRHRAGSPLPSCSSGVPASSAALPAFPPPGSGVGGGGRRPAARSLPARGTGGAAVTPRLGSRAVAAAVARPPVGPPQRLPEGRGRAGQATRPPLPARSRGGARAGGAARRQAPRRAGGERRAGARRADTGVLWAQARLRPGALARGRDLFLRAVPCCSWRRWSGGAELLG